MRLIDRQYTARPFYGSRRVTAWLRSQGHGVNRQRVQRLLGDQVWSADITYLPLAGGFMYLAATIDWFSRYVVAWKLSNTLDGA